MFITCEALFTRSRGAIPVLDAKALDTAEGFAYPSFWANYLSHWRMLLAQSRLPKGRSVKILKRHLADNLAEDIGKRGA